MSDNQSNNKRIAKNAAALYFRMFITMLVGLYTSRIILQALGVEDYGLYNVVGGFVGMFSIISGSLSAAISRFLTYELGTGNKQRLKIAFSTSIYVQFGLSVVIVLLAESIGLWYLYNKMVIAPGRLFAANWAYQFSIVSFILGLLSAPYNAVIISHEKMGAFAYISIYEVVCKLLICFAVIHSPIDKLIFYSLLLMLVGVSVRILYVVYCNKKFEECSGGRIFDKTMLGQMFGFAGWNFIGASSSVLRNQGGTLLLNAFGGTVVNAANGIGQALSAVVINFVSNFTVAFSPQITKSYASKNYTELEKLLTYGPKLSFYMMFFLGLPVMLNADYILHLWLGTVPGYSVDFMRLIMIFSLNETISGPLITAKLATGNIKNYQIVVGGVQMMALPLAYVVLKLGAPVTFMYVAYIITSVGCFIARIVMLRGDIPEWSSRKFFYNVFCNVWGIALISSVIPLIIYLQIQKGFVCLIITTLVSVLTTGLSIFYVGLNKTERNMAVEYINRIKNRIFHK